MFWNRLGNHRMVTANDLRFPPGVRHRLATQYPHLTEDDLRLAEASTRQWFRLLIGRPDANLTMPSVIANELWRELTRHEREYTDFCDAAFGRPVPHRPGWDPAGTDAKPLLTTLRYARRDERTNLPLLFRVDRALNIQNGNCFLADCGGRGECFPVPGLICLHHLRGPGRRNNVRGMRGHTATVNDAHYGPIGGDG